MATRTTTRNRINRAIGNAVDGTYHDDIPMDEIFDCITAHDGTPVQEDGTPWSGFMCGADGRATIEVTFPTMKSMFVHISWHKMESGRFEVVTYIS